MINIIENFLNIRGQIPSDVVLVAVSKFKPIENIISLYENTGHTNFGENRANEFIEKAQFASNFPLDWHFIGNIQTNKIKSILPYPKLVQSVSNNRIIETIDKYSSNLNIKTNCLLQFHIAEEETKQGFSYDEIIELFESNYLSNFKNINFSGVMGMATYTEDEIKVAKEFKNLRKIFENLKKNYFTDNEEFNVVSMGMSGDYKIAISEGSNMVRIGSLIFGER